MSRTQPDFAALAGSARGRLQIMRSLAAVAVAGLAVAISPAARPAHAQAEAVSAQASRIDAAGAISAAATSLQPAAAAYRARIREAIAPLVSAQVSDEDKKNIKAAAIAIGRSELGEAAAIQARITDPVGRKLVDWYRLQRGFGSPEEASQFLAANPEWPDEDTIRRRMEEAVFGSQMKPDAVIALFKRAPPAFGPGRAALAAAHLANGEVETARRLAATAWRGDLIPDSLEAAFLDRLGKLLTEADHKWRLDVILGEERRWTSERRARAADARRVAALLSPAEQVRARARIAVYLRDKSGPRMLRAAIEGRPEPRVKSTPKRKGGKAARDDSAEKADKPATSGDAKPAAEKGQDKVAGAAGKTSDQVAATASPAASDWGLQLDHVRILRRERKYREAARVLRRAPVDPAVVASLDGWWEEREAVGLALIADGDYKTAYAVVRDAGPLSVNPAKDQAFMAGHIALRHLKDAAGAVRHFTQMRKAADGPLSRAKSEYWLALAHAAAGDRDAAAEHYRRGAAFIDTFDGQLARLAAYPGERRLDVPLPDAPEAGDITRFLGRDAVAAGRLALLSGFTRRNVMTFFARLSHRLTSEAELAMLGELAIALGDTQIAVRAGKAAVARGRKLYLYAYPTEGLPGYTPLRTPPEPAMLLAIARQETEFNSQIVSGAGARGILQVMPVTARHVCRNHNVKCDIPRLITDPVYNITLASAYIAERTEEFGGSYILTLTGYNAGPGRTREWLGKLGDPRGGVAPLDWIHRIPFEETRLYVQKVLSNLQMYRSLLGEPEPLRLDLDMKRGRAGRNRGEDRSAAGDGREPPG